jgi:hypothetical protein
MASRTQQVRLAKTARSSESSKKQRKQQEAEAEAQRQRSHGVKGKDAEDAASLVRL